MGWHREPLVSTQARNRTMNQEDIQKALEAISKGGITVAGDLVLEKKVEYEVANVEAGGIGIQINHGKVDEAMTASDKDIKTSIEELLKKKDDRGEFVFRNKKQWWAVFRVLSDFCNYPKKMTAFVAKMNELQLEHAGNSTALTYDSLSAAPKEVPQMACSPSVWSALKDINDNYRQQYVVAEFLMLQLGIKS